MIIKIPPECDGMTVKDYARKVLSASHALLTRLKQREGGILLNGQTVFVNSVVHAGDELFFDIADREEDCNEYLLPVKLPLDIVYEDENIIVPSKPSAMPTHTSHLHYDDTLANALAYYFSQKNIPFVFRAVNRLDADTSGLVLVAKNQFAAGFLANEMAEGRIEKHYTAVCDGIIENDYGFIEKNIRRCGDSIITRECCEDTEGEYARTEYRVLSRKNSFTVLDVMPKTGRTHQIRVHFAYIGHPLLGDYLYGKEGQYGLTHHLLHCSSLTFNTPSGNRLTLCSEFVMPELDCNQNDN